MTAPVVATPTVAIVGAGPAGLSAATALAGRVEGEVLVIDREATAGGIPRHADHPGYGIRDRKRFLSGPGYARKLVAEAEASGARILTRTQVTGWADDHTMEATSPQGRLLIRPSVVLLATGARERPRSARRIPGDRVAGVYTTGQIQNMVHLHHQPVGERAVIVGAELVSWSAALTLSEAGCRTEALISQYPKGEAYPFFTHPGKLWFRTRVVPTSEVVAVKGRGRVSAVDIRNTRTGRIETIACDTVVFTGDWIPDHELARLLGLQIDPANGSPVVDAAMRTSKPGVFAVGNLNHPVETADVVALEGRHVADRIAEYLGGAAWPGDGARLRVEPPLRWVSPTMYRPGDGEPARNRLVCWIDEFITAPVVTVRQGGKQISRTRLAWSAAPGRAFRIPSKVLHGVDARAGDVTIAVD
jgi:thioredoxin reductase